MSPVPVSSAFCPLEGAARRAADRRELHAREVDLSEPRTLASAEPRDPGVAGRRDVERLARPACGVGGEAHPEPVPVLLKLDVRRLAARVGRAHFEDRAGGVAVRLIGLHVVDPGGRVARHGHGVRRHAGVAAERSDLREHLVRRGEAVEIVLRGEDVHEHRGGAAPIARGAGAGPAARPVAEAAGAVAVAGAAATAGPAVRVAGGTRSRGWSRRARRGNARGTSRERRIGHTSRRERTHGG